MKKNIFRMALCAAILLPFASCSDEPHGESTKHPVGTEPSGPEIKPDDDVKSPVASFPLTSQKATLSSSKTYQEMDGFGASDCWLPNQIGQYWTSNRNEIAQMLFSQSISSAGQPQGIGLSMWRVNLGAGTAEQGDDSNISANNRAETYLKASGNYDWNSCAGQRYFMEQAKSMGCENFVLFSNSPLVQYTINGMGYSDNGSHGNLTDEGYAAYAEYMAEVAKHFTDAGYNVSHISPVNEPQYNWGPGENGEASQEGSGWQNEEVARLARELDKSLTARNLSTGIMIGEAGHWPCLYEGPAAREKCIDAFYDPSSKAYVGDLEHTGKLICAHSYWTEGTWNGMRDVRAKVKAAADAKGLKVYQTEWSMLGDAPADLAGGYDGATEFDIAQYMSRVIHNDITVAGVSSWSYWTAMSVERWGQKNRFELIQTTPQDGNYSDNFQIGGTVRATPNLWVLGNYSLFVRPGYKRIDLTLNESQDFFGSAYIAPDNSKIVVVLTNYDKENGMTIDMPHPDGTKAIFTYTTTETKNLRQARFNLNDKVFIDPASVTTIVYHL